MKRQAFPLLLLLIGIIVIPACDPETPEPPNQEELITTLTYTLESIVDGSEVVFSFMDLDGDGGESPIISSGALQANTNYTCKLELLNEQATPTINVTNEISAEATDHQFFFLPSDPNISTTYIDLDAANFPLGLLTTLRTSDSSTGTFKITLRHKPEKTATGVSTGDISNAGGDTDIEITFDLEVL